jgi:hypothetical protein
MRTFWFALDGSISYPALRSRNLDRDVLPRNEGPVLDGRGRPAKLMHSDAEHQPVSVKDLALALPSSDWRTIT